MPPKQTYHVTWAIEIEADTPLEAAQQARAIHQNPSSIATVYLVETPTSRSLIDLMAGDQIPCSSLSSYRH